MQNEALKPTTDIKHLTEQQPKPDIYEPYERVEREKASAKDDDDDIVKQKNIEIAYLKAEISRLKAEIRRGNETWEKKFDILKNK